MNIAEKAFNDLFPDKSESRDIKISYSNKFKQYNANVRYNRQLIAFSLSKSWKEVSKEIQIGLIQSLMLRVFKEKKKTMNMDLYENFLKNLPKYSVAENIDSLLEESFDRVNRQYFHNYMDTPNLVWGRESFRKLGSYEYATNTIIISTILENELELLDYVMYHEMLHKKLKFTSKNGRNLHHSTEFRRLEKEFENKDAERKLTLFLRKKRFKKAFRFF
ncbi:MAG: SprT-like domain-containing protein [archaeon]